MHYDASSRPIQHLASTDTPSMCYETFIDLPRPAYIVAFPKGPLYWEYISIQVSFAFHGPCTNLIRQARTLRQSKRITKGMGWKARKLD